MFKAKGKVVSLLTACLTALFALVLGFTALFAPTPITTANADDTAVALTIKGTTGTLAADKNSISWTSGDVTFTNKKGSTNIRNSDSAHYRAYANSQIVISVNGSATITKVVITLASTSSDYNGGTFTGDITYILNGTTLTITPTTTANSISFKPSKQFRITAAEVTYTSATSTCEHVNKTETTTPANCTEAGSTVVTCNDCEETLSTTPIPAKGHTNEDVEIIADATCTTPGSKSVRCTTCQEENTIEIPATGHKFENGYCINDGCGIKEPTTKTDKLTRETTGIGNGSGYGSWSGKTATTDAVYAGQSAGANNSIQLRSKESNSGIVTTTSGGNALKITVEWNSNTTANRTLQVYGKNTPYEAATDLYNTDKQGTLLGTIVYGTGNSTELEITGDYAYIGLRSADGAMYLTFVSILWETAACDHANTSEVITTPATCTESGSRTVTCLDCEAVLEAEILPATGHNYAGDSCENCGKAKPSPIATLTFDDASKRNGQVWSENDITLNYEGAANDYIQPARFYKNGNLTINYGNMVIIEFYCNNEDYATALKNTIGENATIDGTIVTVTFDEAVDSYSITNLSAQVRMDSLTVYTDEVNSINISSASLSIGESLAMNYYVTTTANLDDAVMYFTFNNETYPVDGELQSDGRYVFTLNKIAPQYMGENIKAELKLGDFVLDTKEEYSVKQYAQNKLNDSPSDELKQLLTDLLHYGVAAQNYKNENNLSLDDIENLGTASEVEPTEDDKMVIEKGTGGTAYFTGASVWFDFVNKLCITISTTENVTLSINGTFVEVTDTTIYVEGIKATEFGNELKFELYQNGVPMQTLYYNINSYAYSMKDDATMGELALALYRYGASASAYAEAVSNNA